ncbi:hypothetical protein M153_2500017174 [Pseudoloma neurophilia]|uniref:Transmembrane protein n=1 Tax=Pseudoloma neurophilia TaxID=146866 RepID=A0A0R0M4U5_9MICR|nr:hypothetical protein M153_2500017174 [Pseudoloma neurophilia]
MSLISAIREFFLGPPLQFHHQKTILETINTQLNNSKFAYLIIILSIICFVALFIRISRLKKQTGILPFVVCAILIYSGYCLERSFRVGVDMDAENPLKSILGDGSSKNALIASFLNEGKMQFILNNAQNEQEKEEQSEESENNDQSSQKKVVIVPNVQKETQINHNMSIEPPSEKPIKNLTVRIVKQKLKNKPNKEQQPVLKKIDKNNNDKNATPDPYLPSRDDSTSTSTEPTRMKEKKIIFDDTFEQKDFLKELKKSINKKESAVSKAKAFLTEIKKTGGFLKEDLKMLEENFEQFLKNSSNYKNILLKADISPDLYKIDLEDLKKEVDSRLEIIPLLEKFLSVSRNGQPGIIEKMKSAFITQFEQKPEPEVSQNIQSNTKEPVLMPAASSLIGSKIQKDEAFSDNLQNTTGSNLKQQNSPDSEPSMTNNNFTQKNTSNQPSTTDFLMNNSFFVPVSNQVYLTDKKEKSDDKKKETDFDQEEIENLTFIQAFMVIQGLICLVIFILMVCNLLNIIPACKLILLVILIGNVFIGIVSMVYAQALAKRCIIMDVPNCQNRNLFDVEEVVDILNEREEPKTENAVNFIEAKFKENSDELKVFVEKIETFMKSNESKAMHKIDVFRNMINKLMFIESDFEPTSKFFSPIYTMKRALEDIKHQIVLMSNEQVFPIYRELLEAQLFFDDQKDTIKQRIENFLKLNMKRKEDKANDDCKKEMKKICKAKKDYEQLAFALVVFGLIFVILVCF